MTKQSDEFERKIHRIHELLEGIDAEVTWDDRFPDPDNPSRQRQVDVTIRRDGHLTLVECRLHQSPQDVQWVEQLIGRRQSLCADAVVGVASSGFSDGAIRKAKRYGVILRDLSTLTDSEIRGWGRGLDVTIYYYEYSNLKLALAFDHHSLQRVDYAEIQKELATYPGMQSLFNAAADQLDSLNLLTHDETSRSGRFQLRLCLHDFFLCGEPVVEVGFSGRGTLTAKEVNCPSVVAYGDPGLTSSRREIVVQEYDIGESAATHYGDKASVFFDLSSLELPPLSQVRYISVRGEEDVNMETFGLAGMDMLQATGGAMQVIVEEASNA